MTDNRQTDDRQTDHATEKRVGIGRIACASRATPPKTGQIFDKVINLGFLSPDIHVVSESGDNGLIIGLIIGLILIKNYSLVWHSSR